MPELARHCNELYGVDLHHHAPSVQKSLDGVDVDARLIIATVESVPFPDGFLDCVVAVSTLEFVENIDSACSEIRRVLKSDGVLIIVTPGYAPIVDLGLRILTGQRARDCYGDRRQLLLSALQKYFSIVKQQASPAHATSVIRLYTALKLMPRT
jgi:ubiquinone/menaquinone biosynthesis C-methylase UbiE